MADDTTDIGTENTGTETQGDPEGLGDAGKKALKAERAKAAAAERKAADLQSQLDAAQQAQMSELERAQNAAASAQAALNEARAEALRYRIASEYQIDAEDAALFLTSSDEDTLRRAAERLAARNDEAGKPKPDNSQGRSGSEGPLSNEQIFANLFTD